MPTRVVLLWAAPSAIPRTFQARAEFLRTTINAAPAHMLMTRASDVAPAGYAFDNPYFRGWVIGNTLPDLGISLPMTHLARARPSLGQPQR